MTKKQDKIRVLDDGSILLSNYIYWGDPSIYKKLVEYCDENNIFFQGLLLVFPDDETKIEFLMSWC